MWRGGGRGEEDERGRGGGRRGGGEKVRGGITAGRGESLWRVREDGVGRDGEGWLVGVKMRNGVGGCGRVRGVGGRGEGGRW